MFEVVVRGNAKCGFNGTFGLVVPYTANALSAKEFAYLFNALKRIENVPKRYWGTALQIWSFGVRWLYTALRYLELKRRLLDRKFPLE